MSLLEILQRKLEKHGIIALCIRYLPVISFLFAFLGAGWIFYLPVQGQYRHTYISENALMPSQAYNFYRESEWNFVRGYRSEIEKLADASHEERTTKLAEWLSQTGFKTTIQEGSDEQLSNLYGILHAPRGDDTEAMLLVAPWFTSTGEFNVGGVSLGIAMARYLERLSVWAKNIIVVFPEDQSSLRHWVNGYHETFDHTGGSIEGAIIIEYPSSLDYLKHVEVDYIGVNGQLPNLDLVNSVVMIAGHEGFETTLHGMPVKVPRDYMYRLNTLWKCIFNLATAGLRRSRENCAEALSGWNIQAVTIRAKEFCNEGSDITSFGRIVEAIFRSVNNLLEKWHQSFFFYLMLSPVHFVSIATYLPAAAFLALSYFLASLSITFNNADISFKNIDMALPKVSFLFGLVLVSHSIAGILLAVASDWESTLLASFIIFMGLTLISPVAKLFQIRMTANEQSVLQALSLFLAAVSLLMVTVVHFSLALVSGIAMIPLTLVRLNKAQIKRYQIANIISLIASSPFTSMVALGLLSDGWTLKGSVWSPFAVFQGLVSSFKALNCWTGAFVIIWCTVWSCTLLATNAKVMPTEREKTE